MTDEVARLRVVLEAKTDQLNKSVDRAQKKFDRAMQKMDRSASKPQVAINKVSASLARFAGPAAIGVAVAGAGRVASAALDAADGLDKMALSTDLPVERLQALRFAAEQSGAGADFATAGFERFNRRLGEFKNTGAGPAKSALEDLGLANDVTSGKLATTEQTLDVVLERLAGIQDSGQRAAQIAKLFGDDAGPKLARLLSQGVDSMKELEEQAHSLGIVLSEELISDAVKTRDEWNKLVTVMDTRFKRFALETISGWKRILASLSGEISAKTDIDLSYDRATVARDLTRAKLRLRQLEEAGQGGGAEAQNVRDTMPGMESRLSVFDSEIDRRAALKKLEEDLNSGDSGGGGGGGGSSKTSRVSETERAAEAYRDLALAIREQREELEFEIGLIGRSEQEQAKLRTMREADLKLRDLSAKATEAGTELRAEEVAEVEAMVIALVGLENQHRREIEAHRAKQDALEETARGYQNLANKIGAAIQAGRGISGILTGILTSVGGEAFTGFLTGEGVFGGLSPVEGGLLPSVPRASGGRVRSGAMYRVGEVGPEPFIPDAPGRIISHAQAMSALAGGGGGVIINNYAQADVSARPNAGPRRETVIDIIDRTVGGLIDTGGTNVSDALSGRNKLVNRA